MYSQTQVPRVETQRSTQVSDVSAQSGDADLMVNNLIYEQPKALSLATHKNYQKNYFQRDTYDGSTATTAICDWNTGSSYVNTFNSYLTFELEINGQSSFGSGSAMNVIREIRIRSRSGTELDRLTRANLWSKFHSKYTNADDYITKFGQVQGFGRVLASGVKEKYCLPLTVISPFFAPMKGQLLPPQLASGLHIEIVFEDIRTAFTSSTNPSIYTVSNIDFQLECVELTDETQKTINMESADNGLEYAYERVYTNVSQNPTNQTTSSIQIRKAVSQACYATSIVLDSANQIDLTADSIKSINWETVNFQYRLGAIYFPNQRVEGAVDGVESYLISQQTYDKLQNPSFESSVGLNDFKTGLGVMACSMEKDTHLNMSGLPINNSRVLELNCEFVSVTAPRDIITFLTYCSVARTYIDNVAVAI